ncbi:MAG: alpha/beta hydrolase [Chloroflexota bacterium]
MNRAVRTILIILGILIVVGVAGVGALYIGTAGDYPVQATVVDDPALPSTEINGVRLHAETFGDPANPVVIVLHGGPGGDYRSLLGLQGLADAYYVVFYDQRGAGLSERVPAEMLALPSYLEELDAVVDQYGQGQPVSLIGHSWGGMLLSAYLGYAPEKVEKAVLAEPGFLNMAEFQSWQERSAQLNGGLDYIWFAARTGFAAQHGDGPDEDAGNDYLYGEIVHHFVNHPDNPYHCPSEAYDAPSWRFGAQASQASNQATEAEINSLADGAEQFTRPVLFPAGECDTWIGANLQTQHADMYADADLVVIPAAGHDMFWDNPADSLAAVRAYLDS